jgi:hypothetical protein
MVLAEAQDKWAREGGNYHPDTYVEGVQSVIEICPARELFKITCATLTYWAISTTIYLEYPGHCHSSGNDLRKTTGLSQRRGRFNHPISRMTSALLRRLLALNRGHSSSQSVIRAHAEALEITAPPI